MYLTNPLYYFSFFPLYLPQSLLSSKGEFARQISAKTAKFAYQNPRYIALYRPSHTPWVQYELTSQPETAKECHERVLAAYEQGDYETARMQFHRYRSLGVLPLTETWHKILLIAYKEGNYHDIESLFATLMEAGVTIDIVRFLSIFVDFCRFLSLFGDFCHFFFV